MVRAEETSSWVNIGGLVLTYLINMPPEANVYETLRIMIESIGYDWKSPIFDKIRKANNYN